MIAPQSRLHGDTGTSHTKGSNSVGQRQQKLIMYVGPCVGWRFVAGNRLFTNKIIIVQEPWECARLPRIRLERATCPGRPSQLLARSPSRFPTVLPSFPAWNTVLSHVWVRKDSVHSERALRGNRILRSSIMNYAAGKLL